VIKAEHGRLSQPDFEMDPGKDVRFSSSVAAGVPPVFSRSAALRPLLFLRATINHRARCDRLPFTSRYPGHLADLLRHGDAGLGTTRRASRNRLGLSAAHQLASRAYLPSARSDRYAPPQRILRIWEKKQKPAAKWPAALVDLHEQKYGPQFKPGSALAMRFISPTFTHKDVDHVHVHFAIAPPTLRCF